MTLHPRIREILVIKYPSEIIDALLESYTQIVINYRIEKWKPSELDAGHFVESMRRIIEQELFGSYTPISSNLPSFNAEELRRYENATGDETFRFVIPRILHSVYCIRNKRGVGHVSHISPNKMDASYILSSVKWALADLIRVSESCSNNEALSLIEAIVSREVDLIWDDGESFLILDTKLNYKQKVLLTLYKKGKVSIDELQNLLEYKNKSNFKKLLKDLKSRQKIDIIEESICKISPLGVVSAESIIQSNQTF